MDYFLAVFSGSFQAGKIKMAAERSVCNVSVVQIPSHIADGGCSYAVKVDMQNKNVILDIAKSMGIRVKDMYELYVYKSGYKEYTKL